MIDSYNLGTQLAKLTVDEQLIAQVSVLITQTDAEGRTIGMASAQVDNPTTAEVPGKNQYTFGVTLTVSDQWSNLTSGRPIDGFVFGTWGDGSLFSWADNGVPIVAD
jgi:hypothetical protein